MKRILWVAVVLALIVSGTAYAQSGGGFNLSWSSVDGGGMVSSQGGSYTLGGTIGQADAGTLSGGGFTLQGGFGGNVNPVGVSALTPTEGASAVDTPTTFTLTWTHPVRWRDLATLDVRLRDEQGTVLWARFTERADEAGGDLSTFSLLDAAGNPVGGGVPGSGVRLESETAVLYLEQSVFQAAGSDDPTVAVDFTISFKAPAAERVYDVEGLATDDFGNVQGPEHMGRWRVGANQAVIQYLPLISR